MKKPKELTELGTGRSQFVWAGVQRVQLFVHGYRECNTPVQVKGGSLAQLSGVSPLSTRYITWRRKPQGISFAARLSCRGNQKEKEELMWNRLSCPYPELGAALGWKPPSYSRASCVRLWKSIWRDCPTTGKGLEQVAAQEQKLEELTMKIEDWKLWWTRLPILPMTRRLRSLLILWNWKRTRRILSWRSSLKHGFSPLSGRLQRNRICNETIGWRDCQNHKCYEINHSENPNYADETRGQKSRNGANQEESQKFHYRAVEPQKERNGRAWSQPDNSGEKQKNRIWNFKALAIFVLKMTGAFVLGSRKTSSIL